MSKFNLKSKQEIIGSAKRAFSISFPFYVFALGVLLAFSAFQCEGEEWCAEPPTCEVIESEVINVAEITVEQVICGTGLWDNLWFNDGSEVYLQPYSLDENAKAEIEKIEIKDEMNLKVNFQYAQKDKRYDDAVICMAYVGEKNPIKIMAIEVINN